jgi:hypothetical protein
MLDSFEGAGSAFVRAFCVIANLWLKLATKLTRSWARSELTAWLVLTRTWTRVNLASLRLLALGVVAGYPKERMLGLMHWHISGLDME